MTNGLPSKRREAIAAQLRKAEAAPVFGLGNGRIYGLILMLLLVVFVLLNFRGAAPGVLERVFPPQAPMSAEQQEQRRLRLKDELQGALFDPPDGTDFVQTKGYQRLLSSLFQATAAGAKNPIPLDRDLAMRNPDEVRGERVVVHGFTGRDGVFAVRLNDPLLSPDGPITDVWRILLTDGERDNAICIDVLKDPGNLDLSSDELQIDAVFWRIVKYEVDAGVYSNGKRKPSLNRELPYLVARSVTRLPDSTNKLGGGGRNMWFFSAALGGMVLFGIYRVVASHKKSALRASMHTSSFHSKRGSTPPPEPGSHS
jgi:hypothetical protein